MSPPHKCIVDQVLEVVLEHTKLSQKQKKFVQMQACDCAPKTKLPHANAVVLVVVMIII